MTIEEKAAAYDKAFGRARGLYAKGAPDSLYLEEIFPELKESGDEKIREAAIEFVRQNKSFNCCLGISKEQVLAWLEKQGEQKDSDVKDYSSIDPHFGKSIDKVEPKFKVGDWIVYKDNVWKICNISLKTYYELLTINNEVSTRRIEDVDKTAHLWTVQDAKDGDVVCSNQIILLFKQWEYDSDCNFVISHAGIDISGELQITDGHWLISNESKPATKEQRDTLIKAMADAGWEFDFEKKKLKKIDSPVLSNSSNTGKDEPTKWNKNIIL